MAGLKYEYETVDLAKKEHLTTGDDPILALLLFE